MAYSPVKNRDQTMLTLSEIAHVLQLHPCTINRMVNRGEIPAVKLPNGFWRVRREDFEKLLEGTHAVQT